MIWTVVLFCLSGRAWADTSDCDYRLSTFGFAASAAFWSGNEVERKFTEPLWADRVLAAADRVFPLRYVLLTADLDAEHEGAVDRAGFRPPTAVETMAWQTIFARDTDELARYELMVIHHPGVFARVIRARQAYLTYLTLFHPEALPAVDRRVIAGARTRMVARARTSVGPKPAERIEAAALRYAMDADRRAGMDERTYRNFYRWIHATFLQFPHLTESEAAAMRIFDFDRVMTEIGPD